MNDNKKIAIITNIDCDPNLEYAKRIIDLVSEFCVDIYIDKAYEYFLGADARGKVKYVTRSEDAIKFVDFFIVLGGDGSLLDVCEKVSPAGVPVFGINLGNLGFLASAEKDDEETVRNVMRGNYFIDERSMLSVDVMDNSVTHTFSALNDVVVSSAIPSKLLKFEMKINNGDILSCRADGMIISTPTGSTAYSLSAGGPIIDPSLGVTCITPVSPFCHSAYPAVVSDKSIIKIKAESRTHGSADIAVTCDGRDTRKVSDSALIVIKKSRLTAKIIKTGDDHFYGIVNKKLFSNK